MGGNRRPRDARAPIQVGRLHFVEAGCEMYVRRFRLTTPADASEHTAEPAPDGPAGLAGQLRDRVLVHDLWLDVTTAEATGTTKTLDIGLLSSENNGDADGFVSGLSMAATGLIRPGVTETAGGTETFISAVTYGALLADFELGSNTAGDHGYIHRHPHIVDADARTISYTPGSADWAEFDAWLYVLVTRITDRS